MGFESEKWLVLGSSSPYRAELIAKMTDRFTVMAAGIDEKAIRSEDPETLTMLLAEAKGVELAKAVNRHFVLLTCDTVVSWGGKIREKPVDEAEARQWIREYAEAPPVVHTSVVVQRAATGEKYAGTEAVAVCFKPSLADAVDDIMAEGSAMKTSGALLHEIPVVAPHVQKYVRIMTRYDLRNRHGRDAETIPRAAVTHSCATGLPLQLVYTLLSKMGMGCLLHPPATY